jgi:predicted nuclease with TOPRIM domain
MGENRERLDRAIKRRDKLRNEVQRVAGKLEAARTELASVEAECRDKGVSPDKLDAVIEQLEQRYEEAVSDLETRIGEAEEALEPFVGEER